MKIQLIQEAKMSFLEKQELRQQLDQYYNNVNDYLAFVSVSHQVECWVHVENEIQQKVKENQGKKINVLEIGAGRSGFGEWLKKRGSRDNLSYWVQDVTSQNATCLESQADHIVFGDVSEIPSKNCFEIVFSTYVLEHVTNPTQHLDQLYKLLCNQGSLFIFCPRYDMPGYLCPSSRHLSWFTRLNFEVRWSIARCTSLIKRRPAFLIQTDLAAFHRPFFLDADAVHWVSLLDLKLWARKKGARINKLKIGNAKPGSKNWVVKRWLTCALEIRKVPV